MMDTLAIIVAFVVLIIWALWRMVELPDERYTEIDRERPDYPRKPWEED